MLGTLFLFVYWPSFNSAMASGDGQFLAILNTLLSIAASCFMAATVCLITLNGKLDMQVILNATLSGGVVIAATCDLITNSGLAMLAGNIIGGISAIGFLKVNKSLQEKANLHDTCGVLFSHGIPAILGSILAMAYPNEDFEAKGQIGGPLITLISAIATGALSGFIVSKLPMPERMFDDQCHFAEVKFGDDTKKFDSAHVPPPAVSPE